MAILPQDDKQNTQPGQQGSSANPIAGQGASGSVAGAGPQVSTAGVGAGGTGAWTNIQSYLQANQGNNSSADALNSQVGSSFDKDQKNLNDQSSQAKQQAQSATQATNIGQDQASKMIQQAGGQYQYNPQGGSQSQDYQKSLDPLKTALSAQYQGPNQFSYGLSADSQNYGTGLGSDQGFQGVMNNVYNKAAGGQINSGQLALQNQLDTGNQALADTRNNLLSRYSGLNQGVTDTNSSTQQAIKDAQNQFSTQQQGLRDYLTGASTADKGAIDNAVGGWNTEEDRDMARAQGAAQDYLQNAQSQWLPYYVAQHGGYDPQMGTPQLASGIVGAMQSALPQTATAGQHADSSTIGGVATQRNEFNAIQDALGLGGNIGHGADVTKHASGNLDPLVNALGSQGAGDYAQWLLSQGYGTPTDFGGAHGGGPQRRPTG